MEVTPGVYAAPPDPVELLYQPKNVYPVRTKLPLFAATTTDERGVTVCAVGALPPVFPFPE